MRRVLLIVAAGILLTACASKYRVDSLASPQTRLPSQSSFYVVLPKDGAYGSEQYPQSGAATATAALAALSKHSRQVEVASSIEDTTKALSSAKERGLSHVFEPVIVHWEDRATEWSGIPDKLTLKFTVYDVQTGQAVATTVTSASSKWMTFGGDHPQDLLPEPTQRFVNTLF